MRVKSYTTVLYKGIRADINCVHYNTKPELADRMNPHELFIHTSDNTICDQIIVRRSDFRTNRIKSHSDLLSTVGRSLF